MLPNLYLGNTVKTFHTLLTLSLTICDQQHTKNTGCALILNWTEVAQQQIQIDRFMGIEQLRANFT